MPQNKVPFLIDVLLVDFMFGAFFGVLGAVGTAHRCYIGIMGVVEWHPVPDKEGEFSSLVGVLTIRWDGGMKFSRMTGTIALVCGFSWVSAQAEESYLLKEVDPSVSLEVEALTVVKGGRTESSVAGSTRVTRTDLVRNRKWQRRFMKDALGGKVFYHMMRDETGTRIDGVDRLVPGPLAGLTAEGRKNGAGNWSFTLSSGSATEDQVAELNSMAAIENRHWLPNRKVRIGETWEFVPQLIRGVLRRDLPDSVAVGLMELVGVSAKTDGSQEALIRVVVRAGGEEIKGVGNVVGAEGLLSGNLVVNLDRPGEMVLRLNGTVVTSARVRAADSVAKLPVTMRFESKPVKP